MFLIHAKLKREVVLYSEKISLFFSFTLAFTLKFPWFRCLTKNRIETWLKNLSSSWVANIYIKANVLLRDYRYINTQEDIYYEQQKCSKSFFLFQNIWICFSNQYILNLILIISTKYLQRICVLSCCNDELLCSWIRIHYLTILYGLEVFLCCTLRAWKRPERRWFHLGNGIAAMISMSFSFYCQNDVNVMPSFWLGASEDALSTLL